MSCAKCGAYTPDGGCKHCGYVGLFSTTKKKFIAVVHHYFSESHTPYRNNVSFIGDCPVKTNVTLAKLIEMAGFVEDGDEIQITIKKTGNRPHGNRRVRLCASHQYALETEYDAMVRLGSQIQE